ncbi:MAG: dihydroorotate dehydrogenase electron transfer subunit [Candidatus Thermoplasmatota archaeon]|nr:dihydroorotate dehydrogenase electron transfer subunit [Candidatus Thermoplasmatota archaeon]
MPTSRLHSVILDKVMEEASHTKSFSFREEFPVRPGQFIMVWIPGVEEVPMALSQLGPVKAITAKNVGSSTEALHKFKEGDRIGVRGPYGNSFDLSQEHYLVAAGGTGIASVIAASEALAEAGKKVVTVFGAKTKEDLILLERSRKYGEVFIATDDGSVGYHGVVSDLALKLMEDRRFDGVLACGPEKMLQTLEGICRQRDVEIQVSMERFMRCGIGLCGSCSLDHYLVCRDGPIFKGEQLVGLRDFGHYRRDRAGRRVPM